MVRLDDAECRRRLTAARHAYLATASAEAVPHVVPVTYAVVEHDDVVEVVSAVDHKPKTTTALRRLRNLQANPLAAVLTDAYDDDWTRLWWVRADGVVTVDAGGPSFEAALDALATRYPQYRERRPAGPVLRLRVRRWSGWAYAAGP